MPQATQIAPKWLHPHIMTVINDNTVFEDSIVTVDNNVKFLAVFMSSKGQDNKIIKKTDIADFYRTFGKSDYAKYGQPLLMPIAELTNGNASVYCMRVMPGDATYANIIVSALYKTETDEESGESKFVVKYHGEYVSSDSADPDADTTGATVTTKVQNAFAAAGSEDPDENGFTKVPLFYITVSGRGSYGNNIRFRITREESYEKDYKIKMYSFEALSSENGISSLATYIGSLVTSARYDDTTFISDIITDKDAGEAYFDVQVDEGAVEQLYSDYLEVLNKNAESGLDVTYPDLDEFDPLFGMTVASAETHDFFEVISDDETDPDVINLNAAEGVALLGGSDGAFDSPDETLRNKAIEDAYINAFTGELDSTILAPRRTPLDIMLDANYPINVKNAIYELALLRDDCPVIFDTGIIFNRYEINTAIREMKFIDNRCASKEFQHYQIRDPKTKKKVSVTTTYKWATSFATHIKTYGCHIPFVKGYATLTGHVKNSLAPSIEMTATDMELKELLYENRFNYYETTADNTFERSVQNTAQSINSDLLEENNMRTLFEMKKIIEDDVWNNMYNFADADQRADFTATEQAKFASWQGSKVQSFNIKFDMSAWEAERSILHCYLEVVFRQIYKRVIIEIDVNKRNYGVD